jgi:hypothetical protein
MYKMPKKTFFWLFRLRNKKKEKELASCAPSRFNFEYILIGRRNIVFLNHVETIGISCDHELSY